MSDEDRLLNEAVRRHLPEATARHIDRATVIVSRAVRGNPVFVVESYDREYQPLKANIGTIDGAALEIRVRYEDGRWHVERWVDGEGELVDGHHHRPKLWGDSFGNG
jgi:hypothetical protein